MNLWMQIKHFQHKYETDEVTLLQPIQLAFSLDNTSNINTAMYDFTVSNGIKMQGLSKFLSGITWLCWGNVMNEYMDWWNDNTGSDDAKQNILAHPIHTFTSKFRNQIDVFSVPYLLFFISNLQNFLNLYLQGISEVDFLWGKWFLHMQYVNIST